MPDGARSRDRGVMPNWPRGLREELAALYVGLSVSSLRILVKAGDAPAPVRLTPGRLVWLRDDKWSGAYEVECTNLDCGPILGTAADAVAYWNKRTP